MKKLLILCLVIIFLPINSFSEDKIEEIRKDIAILKEGQDAINKRIDDVNKRIDDLRQDINQRFSDIKDIMVAGFGILFSGMCVLIGFVLWDRRTALAPAVKEIEELKQKEKTVEEVLRVYARKNMKFKEAMQVAGLL